MRRKNHLPFTLLRPALGISLLLLHAGSELAFGLGSPNIVLVLADDMGWTDWQKDAALNPTGSVVYETPSLLRLAQQGVTFNHAYAAAPLCSPTRTALLTGKTPARTKLTQIVPSLSPAPSSPKLSEPPKSGAGSYSQGILLSEVTLAESLRAAGYSTGFVGKWHLGLGPNSVDPLSHGFDVNVAGYGQGSPANAGGFFAGSDGMWAGMPGLDTPGAYPAETYLSDALDEKATEFISQHASGPFFLEMSQYLVHTPIEAPTSLVTKYQSKINALQGMGVDLKGHTNATYAAMVEKLDDTVGRLLNILDDPNNDGNTSDSIRDNTIFVFTSDNGGLWAPGSFDGAPTRNLPLREGKGSLYEGGIREPLLVSWTGNANIEQGTVSSARSSTYDLYPTVLDLAGFLNNPVVPKNANMDGMSIRAALEGENFDRGYLYWHFPHISNQSVGSPSITAGSFVSAVSDDNWKLVFFYEDRHYELYNLASDIGETTSVLGQNPAVAFDLSRALHDYLQSVNALMPISKATLLPVDLPPTLFLGDYDRNGVVNQLDYSVWLASFGKSVTFGTGADGNGDGKVDAADYVVWRSHFVAGGAGSASLYAAVPEPGTAGLFAIALFACWCASRLTRRRSRGNCATIWPEWALATDRTIEAFQSP